MHAQERNAEAMAEPGLHAAQVSEGAAVDFEQSQGRIGDGRFGVGQVCEQRQAAEEIARTELGQGLLDRIPDPDLECHAALGDQVDRVARGVAP